MANFKDNKQGTKQEILSQLHSSFELAVNETDGVEYWLARDLQELLGYSKWENFIKVIDKAKIASTNAKQEVSDHFPDVRKMVDLGSGAKREIDGIVSVPKNGQLKQEGKFVQSKATGEFKLYNENGELIKTTVGKRPD